MVCSGSSSTFPGLTPYSQSAPWPQMMDMTVKLLGIQGPTFKSAALKKQEVLFHPTQQEHLLQFSFSSANNFPGWWGCSDVSTGQRSCSEHGAPWEKGKREAPAGGKGQHGVRGRQGGCRPWLLAPTLLSPAPCTNSLQKGCVGRLQLRKATSSEPLGAFW